jgi:glutathione S-transferase
MLFGHFTIADAMFAPIVTRFVTYDITLDPVSEQYKRDVIRLPAMVEWANDAKREREVIEGLEIAPERFSASAG